MSIIGSDSLRPNDISNRPTKVYCETDYFEEYTATTRHPNCYEFQTVTEPSSRFDYGKFDDYLKCKLKVEQVNRSVQVIRGQVPPGLEYFTDKHLQAELLSAYGKDLDVSSTLFQGLFETYKEQRLEQIEEWIGLEKKLLRDNEKSLECVDEEAYLSSRFSEAEIKSFLDVAQGLLNPFKLPKQKCGKATGNSRKKAGILGQRNEGVVSAASQVLQKYSNGVTREKFLQRVSQQLLSTSFVNADLIDGYLTKQQVLVIKPFFTDDLVFPAPSKKLLDKDADNPNDILLRFRHKLLVVLNLSLGIVGVRECVDQCKKIFSSSSVVPYMDWGFQSDTAFMKYLFEEKWSSFGVELIQNPSKIGKDDGYCLVVMTNKRKKFLEQNSRLPERVREEHQNPALVNKKQSKGKRQSDARLPKCVPSSLPSSTTWGKSPTESQTREPFVDSCNAYIDSKFVQPCDKIIKEQDRLQPGERVKCVVAWVKSPTNIYLVRVENWRPLNRLFKDMRDYWNSRKADRPPHPQFLKQGYLCMAKPEEDVYRVVVFGNVNPDRYHVYCIDYGDILTVPIEQIRYMPKDFLYVLDAQAIPCALYNVASHQKDARGNDVWSESVCNYTSDILISNDMPTATALFKQRFKETGKWLIKLSTATVTDCGENVMKFVNAN